MKILEFATEAEAQTALHIINEIAAAWWESQEYTVINTGDHKELVGKKNGVDNPDACRTTTWAEIQESPDGTYYFASPATKPQYVDWRNHLEGFTMPDDKEFPEEWNQTEPG